MKLEEISRKTTVKTKPDGTVVTTEKKVEGVPFIKKALDKLKK
ncbi:hypothetical protein AALM99_04810 [Lactococcus muris]|uniref:Uncharacterized protein n=1 Tax=Lactococcus muris TaxID=2941330 RepID=A0ABV4D7N5_9LACT